MNHCGGAGLQSPITDALRLIEILIFMIRIYLCPALMDWLVFLVVFAVMYSAGERGMSTRQCAWLSGSFQAVYMVASLILGLIINQRNARMLLLAGTALSAVTGVFALMVTDFWLILIGLSGIGICMSLFFNGFQTYMRGEGLIGSLGRAIAVYTLAWSLGCGLGPLSSGLVYRLGILAVIVLTVLVGALMFILLLRSRPAEAERAKAGETVEEGSARARPVNPMYIFVAWIMIFTAMFIQRPLLTLLPAVGAKIGMSSAIVGVLLFCHMAVQAAAGFYMMRFRDYLYRRTPFLLIQGVAVVILMVLWRWTSTPLLFVGLSLLGIYMGFIYFCAVYYASNSGRRAFNIGMNECLVGLGSVAGILLSDIGMRWVGGHQGLFLICGAALLLATFLQVCVARPMPKYQLTQER